MIVKKIGLFVGLMLFAWNFALISAMYDFVTGVSAGFILLLRE